MPLADRIRPTTLDEVIGQKHLIGKDKILYRMCQTGKLTSMIFYGPPGVGKTTVANILAGACNKKFYKLNATTASVKDIQDIISQLNTIENIQGIVLYIDEIQNFNKKQQQSILEFMENGSITLIASTTENPYHYVYKAILSRALVYEFKELKSTDIELGIRRAIDSIEKHVGRQFITCNDEVIKIISNSASGDYRRSLNILESCVLYVPKDVNGNVLIDEKSVLEFGGDKAVNFDRDGDSHYDLLSAFHKSIRGSDPDASIYYLARLIKGGDLISICRRLLAIASEDIGLAYPNAVTMVKSCVDSATQLGFPEARLPLAQATLLLATSPKSNSCCVAIDNALRDIENGVMGAVPEHLRDSHYEGATALNRGVEYKYPHDYENHFVKQQYLPDEKKDKIYYKPADNKMENNIRLFLEKINKI
ncbi:putative ATPase [Hathewaya proteolytica DSM 3090]|uniref:Putative ATPase n=1 Tax=Hathewaya proteolytica DSM 3090 TaxID=1121331 RepID=A0A1M6JE65_9CLOT|nr:replication-associated recombination protein A [Hathewaya proteolytica]SHJ44872.1 putative ATPase [Hathewaya proteolytica DSM 3090]